MTIAAVDYICIKETWSKKGKGKNTNTRENKLMEAIQNAINQESCIMLAYQEGQSLKDYVLFFFFFIFFRFYQFCVHLQQ